MNIREHEFVDEWCKWCGLKQNENAHQYGCLQRAIPPTELAPEPKRREYACNDVETISARLAELAKERLLMGESAPQKDELGEYCCG